MMLNDMQVFQIEMKYHAAVSAEDVTNLIATVRQLRLAIDALRGGPVVDPPFVVDAEHLARQRAWSFKTFGPGKRTKGIIDHMTKEFDEILEDPTDVKEWVDLAILALDGAWRCGAEPQDILNHIRAKQLRNEDRVWPDWRLGSEDVAIEHDRTVEQISQDEENSGVEPY